MTRINTLLTAIALTTAVAISFPATAKAEIANLGVTNDSRIILVDSKDFLNEAHPNTFVYYMQNANGEFTKHVGLFMCNESIGKSTKYLTTRVGSNLEPKLVEANSVASLRLINLFCGVRSLKRAGF